MNREWLTSPYGALIFLGLGYLANTTALALADAWAFIRWLKRRRSRPDPAARTPAAKIQRQSLRPVHLPQGPAMPDEIRRTGTPKYGPPRTPPDNGGQARTRPDRRGLVAGGVAALVTLFVLGAIGGAYYLGHRSSGGSTPTKAAAQDLTANAHGCQEFDDALDRMHQALTAIDKAPIEIFWGAQDLRDKVPTAADLTTGETKVAMMRVSTYGKILVGKEQDFMQPGFSDSAEIQGLKGAYSTVYGLCSRAGVTLKNAI